jgi:hypothetical protein
MQLERIDKIVAAGVVATIVLFLVWPERDPAPQRGARTDANSCVKRPLPRQMYDSAPRP